MQTSPVRPGGGIPLPGKAAFQGLVHSDPQGQHADGSSLWQVQDDLLCAARASAGLPPGSLLLSLQTSPWIFILRLHFREIAPRNPACKKASWTILAALISEDPV